MTIWRSNFHNALVTIIILLFGVYATATTVYAQEGGDKPKADDKSTSTGDPSSTAEEPLMIVAPSQRSDQLAMERGCWVKLYNKKNFNGDRLLLIGPINLARMIGPFGATWENNVRSLETGPNANLTIFDNRNFKDEDKFIDASTQIPNLSRKMGLFDNFRSMILSCL